MLEHMDSVEILIEEEERKANEFQSEFNSSRMGTMIHRFPAGLGGINYPFMVPRVVAIGPYHHGKEHLKKMEEVKKAAAYYFCQQHDLDAEEAYEKVLSIVDKARGMYIMQETTSVQGMKDAACFAAMMFRDACFLLLYMDAYSRSYRDGNDEANQSFLRFSFSYRDSIDNDIMLLENQLPWLVVQVLVGALSEQGKKECMTVVREFIAGMGDTFNVTEHVRSGEEKNKTDEEENKIYEENPPPHLLALLRRRRTDEEKPQPHLLPQLQRSASDEENPESLLPQLQRSDEENPQPYLLPLLLLGCCRTCAKESPKSKVTSISAISPMELEEIGIKLTASQKPLFSDMDLVKGRFLGELSLAPLSLSNTRASWLVNMAAFEVCTAASYGDNVNNTSVCSYLALLAMFMDRKEDVHMLRSKGLLHGPHSNKEMLAFFKSVMVHLPDSGSRFAHMMAKIEDYKHTRRIWIKLYKWIYNNYKTILTVLSILATLISLYRAIPSLNKKN